MKEENKVKGNYAEDFLSYLDDNLIENGFAKEIKHIRGGFGGYKAGIGPNGDAGASSIYRLSENPEIGLRVLTQKDFGYNQNPKEWAFVRTFLIPWKDVKNLKDKSLYEQLLKKIEEVINCYDIKNYKNLRYNMKESKRAHVGHFVLVFQFDKKENRIRFDDFDHYDNIYRNK